MVARPSETPSTQKKQNTDKETEVSFAPTQRQYLVLYRLTQLGYASREHLERACFRDVANPTERFEEQILPLVKASGRKSSAPALILEHPESGSLYVSKSGRNLLDSVVRPSGPKAFATRTETTAPAYFRGRDFRGNPIPYNLRALPSERRVTSETRLDEYFGIADVLTRFLECEGGILTTAEGRYALERVEVTCKPSDLSFSHEGKKIQIRPDGLILLVLRDEKGALSFAWLYLEYEETSTPSKKLDTLKEYAQFFWRGEFKRLWNAEYRYTYDLREANEGKEVNRSLFKVLVVLEEGDGSGYLDGILQDFRFLKDVGVNYQELGFPSDVMGLGQFLFCRRSVFVKAEHALAPVWLNGANYQRRRNEDEWNPVSCLG